MTAVCAHTGTVLCASAENTVLPKPADPPAVPSRCGRASIWLWLIVGASGVDSAVVCGGACVEETVEPFRRRVGLRAIVDAMWGERKYREGRIPVFLCALEYVRKNKKKDSSAIILTASETR